MFSLSTRRQFLTCAAGLFLAATDVFAGKDKDKRVGHIDPLRYVPEIGTVMPSADATCDDFKAAFYGHNVGTKTGLVLHGTFSAHFAQGSPKHKAAGTVVTLNVTYTDGASQTLVAQIPSNGSVPLVSVADTRGPDGYVVSFQQAFQARLADALMGACERVLSHAPSCHKDRVFRSLAKPTP